MGEKKFLTYAETAQVTGVNERSIRRLVATGELPSVRFGSCVRVPAAVLDAMVAAAIAATTGDTAEAS